MTAPATTGITAGADATGTFNRRGLALLIAVGLVFAAAFALLSAFGPDLDPGRDGGGHGLSTGATGFAGIVALGKAGGLSARVGRDDAAARGAGLLVLTPTADTPPAAVEALVTARAGAPTLVILPKWLTGPLPTHPGWVQQAGTLPVVASAAPVQPLLPRMAIIEKVLPAATLLRTPEMPGLQLRAPAQARGIAADVGLDPVVGDGGDNLVLGWQSKTNLYVLADPDLVNNAGLRSPDAALAAVRLLAGLGGDRAGGLVFDVTLNGHGIGRSLLRNAFVPPFLALTLSLLVAAALAFWYGLMRFGTPQPAPRAIAFGKLALVDNAASLIRMAGREAEIVPRYATIIADIAATRLRAPPGLDQAGTAAWLAARDTGFATLAYDAASADTPEAALAAAKALHRWQETIAP